MATKKELRSKLSQTEEVMKEAKRLLKVQERKAKKDRERKKLEAYCFSMYSPYDE